MSLALLLAAARAGSSKGGILLLDEIDAALDEHNQKRVAGLLHQLAHDKAAMCQVICVTHNQAFQDRCEYLIRVTKSDGNGSSVPASDPAENHTVKTAGKAGKGRVEAATAIAIGCGSSIKGRQRQCADSKRVRFAIS